MSGLSKTVLICDDDQGMRDTIAAILQREYRVLSVPSGESALAVLKQEDVDVLLLDVRLPGINGLDVLRIVRENYGFVECIVISAISEGKKFHSGRGLKSRSTRPDMVTSLLRRSVW